MIFNVANIYEGSDGDATKALYAHLMTMAPRGVIAVNLMRTLKASGRAKVYRGGQRGRGSYRSMAYDKKDWSIGELCNALRYNPDVIPSWGWGYDKKAIGFEHVLYVDIPGSGQVSFHTSNRRDGPDYAGSWDGQNNVSKSRILNWTAAVLEGRDCTTKGDDDGTHTGTERGSEPIAAGGGLSARPGEEQQEALDL